MGTRKAIVGIAAAATILLSVVLLSCGADPSMSGPERPSPNVAEAPAPSRQIEPDPPAVDEVAVSTPPAVVNEAPSHDDIKTSAPIEEPVTVPGPEDPAAAAAEPPATGPRVDKTPRDKDPADKTPPSKTPGKVTTPVKEPSGKKEDPEDKIIALSPHLRINPAKKYVDADAVVCLTQGMLELLITTPKGKTHESIFSMTAEPRHLHAALLLIGLTAVGSPLAAIFADEDPDMNGYVNVTVVMESDGRKIEVPIGNLLTNEEDEEAKVDKLLFIGSPLVKPPDSDKLIYAADFSGDIASLVQFGDDVLIIPDPGSKANGELVWSVEGDELPDEGTKVVLRFRPAPKEKKKEKEQETQPENAAKSEDGPKPQ